MSSAPDATVLLVSSQQEKQGIAPALAKLAAPTEMSSYGQEQWEFLLNAGTVQAFVVPHAQDQNALLGCVLKIQYGIHQAFGMMLVSKEARGQGIAKKLLTAAMDSPASESMRILGTCTEMGRPMYEKLGFKRVATVTRMSIPTDELQFKIQDSETTNFAINQDTLLPQLLELDQQATGLDRSETLKAIYQYPYVTMVTLTRDNQVVAAALTTQHTNSSLATIGPILGEEALVPTLLQGIKLFLPSSAKEMAVMVSDHLNLVQTLAQAGFQTVFQLGAMTMDGTPLPGQRGSYLGLIHPTLG